MDWFGEKLRVWLSVHTNAYWIQRNKSKAPARDRVHPEINTRVGSVYTLIGAPHKNHEYLETR